MEKDILETLFTIQFGARTGQWLLFFEFQCNKCRQLLPRIKGSLLFTDTKCNLICPYRTFRTLRDLTGPMIRNG